MNAPKKGEIEIRKAKLKAVKNQFPKRDYQVEITLPEFTCLCPITGYPDFAVIHVNYIPDKLIIELKSLKLYINKFRNKEMFHEAAVNLILEDLVEVCKPRWIEVTGDFNPRGNVKTIVRAQNQKEGFQKPCKDTQA
jgi:7-cyano-7-deazaguanine reductase